MTSAARSRGVQATAAWVQAPPRVLPLCALLLALCCRGATGEGRHVSQLCPSTEQRLVPQRSWASGHQRVKLNLVNHAGKPVHIAIIGTDGHEEHSERLRPWHGPQHHVTAAPGSILQIYAASSEDRTEHDSLLFERMVVPHDGQMGICSIFPCGAVDEQLLKDLYVDTVCNDSIPTKEWICARQALPFSEQPKNSYGFTVEEVEAVPEYERIYAPHETETDTEWNAPSFTEGPGYLIVKMPDKVYAAARQVYDRHKGRGAEEGDVPGHYSNYYGQRGKGNAWTMVNLDRYQRERAIISEGVRKVLTAWVGRPLQHEATYGIRVYHENAVLLNHRDVPTTHFVSAVLQINQTAEEGWPLYIETQRDPIKYAEVYLQPGYMALYEGVRLKHGRPLRFNGTEFAMIFTHNRPIDYYPDTHYNPSASSQSAEL
eukprot:TRINITY_DN7040_c0_g2_i1.p1 TRINITY_DN7040_c0_g2~~TRINITY_DN7040_c0_g2_i1.p1  ORF type:complete len:430 (+),score=22.47 TRINITY_DN7040_c0_g2_i1:45-1334(+)